MLSRCILEHFVDSKNLVIAFSAFDEFRKEKDKFDFYSLTKQREFSVVLVRDLNNTWYHRPFDSDESFNIMLDYINTLCKKYNRTIFLGSSMGGYASILFGHLVGADYIISMSPKTIISPSGMKDIGDPRRANALERIKLLEPKPYYPDLRDVTNVGKGYTVMYVSQEDDLDIKHATRLAHQDNVTILMLPEVWHGLIYPLSESEGLKNIIENALSSDVPYDPHEELSRLRKKYKHKIFLSGPITFDAKINNISIPIRIENCSDAIWGQETCGNMRVFFQIVRLDNEEEILWGNQTLSIINVEKNNSFFEVVRIDHSIINSGKYKILMNLGTEKMVFHEIGYEYLSIFFDIYPKIHCNNLFSRDEGNVVLQKITDNGFGYSTWQKRITSIFHFPVSGGRLHTDVGTIIAGDIIIKGGQEGFGVWGPFIALPPGYYDGEFILDPQTTSGNIIVDIVDLSKFDSECFLRHELFIEQNGSPSLKFHWKMAAHSDKLEVRIFCLNDFRGKIHELIIRGCN